MLRLYRDQDVALARSDVEGQSLRGILIILKTCVFASLLLLSTAARPRSLDNPVRPRQQGRRDGDADLFCRPEINDQLEFGRLLDGNIGGLGAF
jgi:hypothetical protein